MEKPPNPKPALRGSYRLKRWAIGCYRLGVIITALVCIGSLPREQRIIDAQKILAEAKSALPTAVSVGKLSEGAYPLLDRYRNPVGWATSTFPQAEKVQGYSGASELLVVFDMRNQVKHVSFLSSDDTDGHVSKIRDDVDFWNQWAGLSESSLGAKSKKMIVSGATLTSEAMARGLAARFGADGMDQWFPNALKINDVLKWFPSADRIDNAEKTGTYTIFKGQDKLGLVLRSSRMGVSARGFNGTSDVIVALDVSEAKILGIGLLGSKDNEPYVSDVGEEVRYADGFAGKSIDEVLAEDSDDSPSLFTSGASFTNYAVVESVQELLRRHRLEVDSHAFPWKTSVACIWIGLAHL